MESIIIANYPRSGARYLTALMCSRFSELIGFNANHVNIDNIEDHPKNGMIIKIHDSDFDFSLPYKTILSYRDPRDVLATFAIDDKISISELINNTVINWVSYMYDWINIAEENDILILKYEDMINEEEKTIDKISEYLGISSTENNKTREAELVAGKRPVGLYKNVFNQQHLDIIQENTQDCLEDLKEYL